MPWTDIGIPGAVASYVLMETGTEIELEDATLMEPEDRSYSLVGSSSPAVWTDI